MGKDDETEVSKAVEYYLKQLINVISKWQFIQGQDNDPLLFSKKTVPPKYKYIHIHNIYECVYK